MKDKMKVGYSKSFFESLRDVLKYETKLQHKVTKSEKAGHAFRDLKKHPDWKKRWRDFCKYDMDWDWLFMVELLVHKLTLMKEYYKNLKHMADDEKENIVQTLEQCIEIGNRVISEDYNQESLQFFKKVAKYTVGHKIVGKKDGKEIVLFKTHDDIVDGEQVPFSSYRKCAEEIKKHPAMYNKYESVEIYYSSDWLEDDRLKYRELIEKENQRKESDIKEFFNKISENLQNWWF